MKKILFFIVAAIVMNTVFADPVPPRLMRNLKAFHVMKVILKNGVLKLTTSHPTVKHEIYDEVIKKGTCSVLLNNPEKGWEKAYIDRIEVWSKDGRQGYAFVDARKACLEMDRIGDEQKQKEFFTGHTWICTAEICDKPD